MRKIDKLISMLIIMIFLCQDAAFCIPEDKSALRVPMGGVVEDIKETLDYRQSQATQINQEQARRHTDAKDKPADISFKEIIEKGVDAAVDPNASPFTQVVQYIFYKKGYVVDSTAIDSGWRARVYKAREIASSRTVAIKIADPYGDPLTPELCQAYCSVMKSAISFWKARRIFNHDIPALVQLYEAGLIPVEDMERAGSIYSSDTRFLNLLKWDYHYQIMEFLEGKKLEKLITDGFFKGKDIGMLIDSLAEFSLGINLMHEEKKLAHGELLSKNIYVSLDEKLLFKAVDLDPLSVADESVNISDKVYKAWQKDCMYLIRVASSVLFQASYETPNYSIINDFFKRWERDFVAQEELGVFSKELQELKQSIIYEKSAIGQKINEIGKARVSRQQT